MKTNLKYLILLISIVYSMSYLYDEINIGGVTMGLYILFNLPLGIIQFILSIYLLKTTIKWQKVLSIIGVIITLLVLIPPEIFYMFLSN